MSRIDFCIPGKLKSGNEVIIIASKKARFTQASHARRQKREIGWMLNTVRGPRPKLPIDVTIVRYGPQLLDSHDNLAFSAKHVVDAIADWYKLPDANPAFIWSYQQMKGPNYQIGISIVSICGQEFVCSCCGSNTRCRLEPGHEGFCKVREIEP